MMSSAPLSQRACRHRHCGCGGQECRRHRQSLRASSSVPSAVAGTVQGCERRSRASRKSSACNAACAAAAAASVPSTASVPYGPGELSWARSSGQPGSRAVRCRSAQVTHDVLPGSTNGPSTPTVSLTWTMRCAMPWSTSAAVAVSDGSPTGASTTRCGREPTGRGSATVADPLPVGSRPHLVVLAPGGLTSLTATAALVDQGIAHLLVHVSETVGVLGPLVLPGSTSCVTCADLHRTARDPGWPLLRAQLSSPGPYGTEAVDGTLAAAAAASVPSTASVPYGPGELSWARSSGQPGSRAVRCRSAQVTHDVLPGNTNGPSTPTVSLTWTRRCAMPWSTSAAVAVSDGSPTGASTTRCGREPIGRGSATVADPLPM